VTTGLPFVSEGLRLYSYVLLLYVIFSWVPRPPDALVPFVLGVRRLVEPVLAPIRRVLPPVRIGTVALDLSILVVFLLLRVVADVAMRLGW
jgi:YggT family protein